MTEKDQGGKNLPALREGLDINVSSRGTLVRPSRYLAKFGFTERLPILLGDLNGKLSSLRSSDPARIKMVLHPNLETPQITWEPAFAPVPEVKLEFPPYKSAEGKLSIGKEILHDNTFYATVGDSRYSDYELRHSAKLRIDEETAVIGIPERTDRIASIDWKQLKDFVKHVFPKKGTVLFSSFDEEFTPEGLGRLRRVAHVSTYSPHSRQIVEGIGSLDSELFKGLPSGLGYSVRIVSPEFVRDLKSRNADKKHLKRYSRIGDVPDNILRDWYDQIVYPGPTPFPSEAFLYVTLEEFEGRRYFEIRRLQYKGSAKSMERVMELFGQLFAKDPAVQAQSKQM